MRKCSLSGQTLLHAARFFRVLAVFAARIAFDRTFLAKARRAEGFDTAPVFAAMVPRVDPMDRATSSRIPCCAFAALPGRFVFILSPFFPISGSFGDPSHDMRGFRRLWP